MAEQHELDEMFHSSIATCHGNAVLNFRHDAIGEFPHYSEAFRDAGFKLLRSLHESRIYSDFEACPILFSYRHAFELSLKGVVVAGARLIKQQTRENILVDAHLRSHALQQFLPAIATIYSRNGWDWDIEIAKIRQWKDFVLLVKYVESIDRNSFVFRYPVDTRGKSSVSHHSLFNPFVFAHRVDPVIRYLNGIADSLCDLLHMELDAVAMERSFI